MNIFGINIIHVVTVILSFLGVMLIITLATADFNQNHELVYQFCKNEIKYQGETPYCLTDENTWQEIYCNTQKQKCYMINNNEGIK